MDDLRVAYPSLNTRCCASSLPRRKVSSRRKVSTSSCWSCTAARLRSNHLVPVTLISSPTPAARRSGRARSTSSACRRSFRQPGRDLICDPRHRVGSRDCAAEDHRGRVTGRLSRRGGARILRKRDGLDPVKDLDLVTMDSDKIRFPTLQTQSIPGDLFNTAIDLGPEGRLRQAGSATTTPIWSKEG